jgi:thymidylate kinase
MNNKVMSKIKSSPQTLTILTSKSHRRNSSDYFDRVNHSRKLNIIDRSNRSTFVYDSKTSKNICDKVLENVRDGSLVFIDLNTKTNFRRSKLPKLHSRSVTDPEKSIK